MPTQAQVSRPCPVSYSAAVITRSVARSDDIASPVPIRPRVVAVVANYGRSGIRLTERAVAAVARQEGSFDLDIVVVDDGSGDDVAERLRAAIPAETEVIARRTNRGYAAACNEGVRWASTLNPGYVWLLNNDIDMDSGTLSRLLETLELRQDWAAAAPATVDTEGIRVLGAGVALDKMRGRVRHLWVGADVGSLPTEPYEVDAIEGSAPLIRMAAMRHVGGLDERYGMYWEDTDWSRRAIQSGWRIGIAPRAHVRHLVSQSTSTRRRVEFLIVNRVRFVELTGNRRERLGFRAYFLLGWLPAYLVFRLMPRQGVVDGWSIAFRAAAAALRPSKLREPRP